MAKDLERLSEFIQAALEEFWDNHPDEYRMWVHHLGVRIEQVKRDEINEREYIAHWMQVAEEKLESLV